MNYYMPYTNYINTPQIGPLNTIIKKGINWKNILTNTQKTLNIINQTIPVIKQVKPVIGNAKTMFKVMNEFKKVETKEIENIKPQKKEEIVETKKEITTNNPTFFL